MVNAERMKMILKEITGEFSMSITVKIFYMSNKLIFKKFLTLNKNIKETRFQFQMIELCEMGIVINKKT